MESLQDRDPTLARRAQTRRAVEGTAAFGGPYLLMNAAATLIAGFGLFEDSPAVIIGAMLIAALLGPIQGMAMALAESDLKLLRVSLTAEILGAALVLVLGIALGTIDRTSPVGHEILARTAPNILDLLIGLVGGAAASFAMATPSLGSLAVGVAIATALVPPLTSCGILIARGLPALAVGAFMLFVANFVAITFSSMVVFMILGHRATIVGSAAPRTSERIDSAARLSGDSPDPRIPSIQRFPAHLRRGDSALESPAARRTRTAAISRIEPRRRHAPRSIWPHLGIRRGEVPAFIHQRGSCSHE